jgi:DnaJ-domain-containing protein 1
MTDNFALLDEPRRPWIDPDSLKEKFLALSFQVHPDRVHQAPETERRAAGERYSELNTAYNCLREPKDRLRHLLELELGAKPVDIQHVPQELMDSFFEVGRLCRDADAFIKERQMVTSPILKVQLFERGQEWTDQLNAIQRKINIRRDEFMLELKAMNSAWESATQSGVAREKLPLRRLEEIYRLLGYFARWSEQIQEQIVQLSF